MKSRYPVYILMFLMVTGFFVSYFTINFLNIAGNNMLSFITILVFIFYILMLLSTRGKINIPKYLWYFIGFTIYTIVSDYFIVGKSISVKYIYSNRLIDTVLIFILVENTFFSKTFIRFITKTMVFVVLLAFVTILIQQFYDYNFFVDLNRQNVFNFLNTESFAQRLPSIYSWQGLLEIGFSFLPMWAILMENSLERRKVVLWLWIVIGILFSFLTKGRWIMLNYLILLLIPFNYFRHDFGKSLLTVVLFLFTIFFSMSVADYFGAPVYDTIENRILEKSHGGLEQGSASTRILAFYVFGQLFPQHPVFGKGDFHTFDKNTDKDFALASALGGQSSQIHVGYLSLLYYYGIVGGFLFIMFLVLLMKRLYADAKYTRKWAPFFGMMGFVLANATLVNFDLFHAGLIITLVFDRYYLSMVKIENQKTIFKLARS